MKAMDLHWDHGEHGARSNMANTFTRDPRSMLHVTAIDWRGHGPAYFGLSADL